MEITMYELLGMIKDNKAPKKIEYNGKIYNYEDSDYFAIDYGYLFDRYNVSGILNNNVEIIEPQGHKIPEKLNTWFGIEPVNLDSPNTFKDNSKYIDFNTEMFFDKINEILDYLKEIE